MDPPENLLDIQVDKQAINSENRVDLPDDPENNIYQRQANYYNHEDPTDDEENDQNEEERKEEKKIRDENVLEDEDADAIDVEEEVDIDSLFSEVFSESRRTQE